MNWFVDDIAGGATVIYKGWSMQTVGLVLLGMAALLGLMWLLQQGTAKGWLRGVCVGMRLLVVVLLCLVLMDPVVRSQELIPQQSYLAHMFDISQSMDIEDMNGVSRIEATKALTTAAAEPRTLLDKIYRHVDFAFDTETVSIPPEATFSASNRPTDLEAALRHVQFQVSGLPLSGIVLYSDGNSTVGANVDSTLETVRALNVPIYTVGTAPTKPGADLWIQEVIHPAEIADYVDTRITALVGARGMAGKEVAVSLFEEGRLVQKRRLMVSTDDQVLSVDFDIRPGPKDYVVYEVIVAEAPGEVYPWNNERQFFMNVSRKERRILFVEGSPRYEYRFLRAAFADDERFQVASMVYVTRDGDFYRQGIEDGSELRQGFPETEEELFAYDVVVVGDISASSFTTRQLEALNEFVRKRGGGLLFLAGRESFARNGFGNTVLANALPFQFHDPRQSMSLNIARTVVPTALGRERSIFGPYDPAVDFQPPWERLPKLDGLYPLYELKPGAQVLCEVSYGTGGANLPIVSFHRYGKGIALACGISATWQWKFQTSADDPSYQAFWKEMVLVLMEGQQELIQVGVSPGVVPVDGETSIGGTVLGEDFELNRTALVSLVVTTPSGTIQELTPRPSTEEGITFEQVFTPRESGIYHVTARSNLERTGAEIKHEAIFLATNESPELAEINLNDSVLRQIASTSGGVYVHLSEYDGLLERIKPLEGSLYKKSEKSAWDSKLILFALLGLLLGEWMMRRMGGLA